MGRKLLDATKACRMRRTRGETGRFFRVEATRRLALPPAGFLLAALFLACGRAALVAPPELSVDAWGEGVPTSGAGLGSRDESASAEGRRAPNMLQRIAAANTHHHLETDRTTFTFLLLLAKQSFHKN
jgi:hypothetical protein